MPVTSPVEVSGMSSVRATPKSITRGPSGPSSTLSGLRSRWTTPASWMAARAVAIAVASRCSSPPARTRRAARRLGPSTYSLTRYGRGPSRSTASTRAVQNDATRCAAAASLAIRARSSGSPAGSPRSTFTATRTPSGS
ncbi:hypothetical protein MF672_041310 [Actinomadura sp. ATCC 31491]|uniref:Uncharacterized protein n=1 Tax=Actinomadura luzonensis TaxID=2805427 RepID=A0ABT0G6H8_9ACTN|nr:hypothetical protein [Actinomadura luzonensis]MCK2220194.1 hypothetical protein [Actinomadura luzonensis]